MKSATESTYSRRLLDYLLLFYVQATVDDKRKEMSGTRDRDYHDAIAESPPNNR